MKGNKRLIEILIVVTIATFIGMIAGAGYIYTLKNTKNNKKNDDNLSKINEIYNTIVDDYYQDVDKESLVEAAVSGMLSVLDKNTSYMDTNTTSNFNKKMYGEYYGIGIEALTVDKGILVVSVANGPAKEADIRANDIIISINNVSLEGKTAAYFTELISNISNEIKLVVLRGDRKLNINIIPEKIVLESVTTNKFTVNNKNIGYIKISIFASNTASQFTSSLKSLEENKIDALVIDVRNNSGGYLSSASSILELFMKKDTILYQTESKSSLLKRKDETDDYRSYPVAILVNGSSASASEVLTAAFMENLNSEVVGTTTYGKGTVQETVSVLSNSTAKITTKKWLTPKGNWIDGVGITPTIVIQLSDKYLLKPTFENDNQLEKAINILSVK